MVMATSYWKPFDVVVPDRFQSQLSWLSVILGAAAVIVADNKRISKNVDMLCSRFFASMLRKGINRIPRINEAGAANGQKAFDFTDRFGDHAVRLAGVKLALQLNKGVISPIKPAC